MTRSAGPAGGPGRASGDGRDCDPGRGGVTQSGSGIMIRPEISVARAAADP